ncbi:unnamed protein product [marine sediment metagenome]|uniref:Uncharacterized protein n=1 Tax=marine sediment metagenome TaxID=412755 RepID=X1LFM8_9ZZZZ
MEDEFETKWEQFQIANWKNDEDKISSFFKRFNLDVRDLYKHVTSIDYDRMQAVCYLLSKIDKAIKICDFLDTLEKDNHEDVDVIKIYILISHAEITSRSLGKKGTKIELVKEFFSPVESSLKYRIKPSLTDKKTPNVNFADILYKIRCEYTHEGNYTGRIFKKKEDGTHSLLIRFKSGNKDFYGECGLTYKEFINIYMKALVENIKMFSDYGK